MLRHRIDVQAGIDDVLTALGELHFVEAKSKDSLKSIELHQGIGMIRELDDGCVVDVFSDDDDGVEVDRLVTALRGEGFEVELNTIPQGQE